MDTIHIRGGRRLNGRIPVSGAKNAALPLMTAALLTDEPLRLTNMPRLADVRTLTKLIAELGGDVAIDRGEDADVMTIRVADIASTTAPYEIVSQIRASFWVLGPLLARCHEARVSLPGGCAIGARPVDLYIKGLQKMGAEIDLVEGYVLAKAPGGLKGA
ncbi:MAG: UDP-N-acetylglucosamine 1-carboxyvinyltransferase, partial [Parvibaculum sp.]|nr:UDP-N-acetylglucosamine 1-carboxyvinyltransferase [Parvibaculum sp.]